LAPEGLGQPTGAVYWAIKHRLPQKMPGPAKHKFHLIAMRRGEWPNQWIWEVFHRGEPLTVRIWGGYYKSEAKALAAGQPTIDALLTGKQRWGPAQRGPKSEESRQ
jgi:hypothetical protein